MDKDELLALFKKADTKHTDLKDAIKELEKKLDKDDADTKSLKATIDALTTKADKFESIVDDLKNEIADLETKGRTPVVAISLKEQNDKLTIAVKTGIGKFLQAGAKAKETGAQADSNFKDFIQNEIKALNLTNTGEGLESVDEVLSREIIERARESYPVVGAVRNRTMPRDLREQVLISFPSVQQGIENVAGTAIAQTTTQTYAEVKNKIAKVNAKPRITDEAMLGSDLDLYGHLLTLLDTEVGRWLALQIYFGNGADKAMRGMLSSNRVDITNLTGESFKPTLNSANPALARDPDFYPVIPTGVSGAMGATDNAIVDFLLDMKNSLPTAYLRTAKWRFNRKTLGVIEKVRDADGKPIFKDTYQDGIVRVLGFPVDLDDDMPNMVADSTFIIFGDMAQAFSISNGDIDKMLLDPYTVDGCTLVKLDKEFFEMVGKNDAIIIGAATTNSGA